jgi:hypothetical protein
MTSPVGEPLDASHAAIKSLASVDAESVAHWDCAGV